MLIENIRLTNFMSVEELSLDFTENIYTVITGLNASGKSALLEAISMALIERRKGDSYRDYVKLGTKKATILMNVNLEGHSLEIFVEINNNTYGTPVKREIKYNDEVYKNSDCNKLLKTFNVKYLQYITFFHQKDSSILNLKPTEVSALLKEIFNIDYTIEAEKLTLNISEMEEHSRMLQAELVAKTDQTSLLTLSNLLDKPEKTERKLLKDISDIKKKLEALRSVERVIEERKKIEDDLYVSKGKLNNLFERKLSSEKTIEINNEKIAQLTKEINEVESILNEVVFNPDESIEALRIKIETLTLLRADYSEEFIPKLKVDITNLEKEIAAHEAGKCPVCHHDLTSELENCVLLKKELEDKKLEMSSKQKASLGILDEINLAAHNKKELETKKSLEVSKLNQAKYAKESLNNQKDVSNENLKSHQKFLERLDSEILEEDGRVKECERALLALPELSDKDNFLSLKRTLSTLEEDIKECRRVKAINEERVLNNEKIINLKKENIKHIDKIKSNINTLSQKIKSNEDAKNIILVDFPNYVILQKTRDLEASMNGIVQRIFPEMAVKLTLKRSGISFYYSPSNGEWLPTAMASGAQAAILMLAWRVALAEMYGITTLCLDEIDADATDENSALIYQFLGSLESFDQIILISHRKSAIKTIRDLNESVQGYWVEDGVYTENNLEEN